MKEENPSRSIDVLIAALNTLEVGELGRIQARIAEIREELQARGLSELIEKIDECRLELDRGNMKNFRRLKETIVSQLGHFR